jgi:hypothetical protein
MGNPSAINAPGAANDVQGWLVKWRPSVRDIAKAQAWVDWLDHVRCLHTRLIIKSNADEVGEQYLLFLDSLNVNFGPLFHILKSLCRRLQLIPSTCWLEANILLDDQRPVHQTQTSDVFKGTYGTMQVALKSLRVIKDEIEKVEKVCKQYR